MLPQAVLLPERSEIAKKKTIYGTACGSVGSGRQPVKKKAWLPGVSFFLLAGGTGAAALHNVCYMQPFSACRRHKPGHGCI